MDQYKTLHNNVYIIKQLLLRISDPIENCLATFAYGNIYKLLYAEYPSEYLKSTLPKHKFSKHCAMCPCYLSKEPIPPCTVYLKV